MDYIKKLEVIKTATSGITITELTHVLRRRLDDLKKNTQRGEDMVGFWLCAALNSRVAGDSRAVKADLHRALESLERED
jgi:hypothetical protein